MNTRTIEDDAAALWDLSTDLTLYGKVELFFRRPLTLKRDPDKTVHSAVGMITKPTSIARPIRVGVSSTTHKSVASSWNFVERNGGWANPTDDVDVIQHVDISRMVFHDFSGAPVQEIINKYVPL